MCKVTPSHLVVPKLSVFYYPQILGSVDNFIAYKFFCGKNILEETGQNNTNNSHVSNHCIDFYETACGE
ncbi:family M13 unassigned peptidase (M13 family) [Schistosoma mansoni]|uniref:family M13 unassigned peptidase (M13 family) n=1 Tax=Schistosoma mansoni TaxID=6183 RepID=UPI00022DC75E|nr:family M13 unassigned peptidase (M13 family) [Schistosoma mansoni]|eukprot:XP_018650342.1 family M13 unassigned peptidase (M13 family) [Schistosoma mansoni]